MTALSTVSPRYASASCLSFCRIIALISGGEYSLSPANARASPFCPETTRYGTIVSSSLTSASLRPMKRLIENTVFSGLVTAWRFATAPTRRSPPPVNATTDGVVRAPSAFSITFGSEPSITAMQELVVPRSIPIVLANSENLRLENLSEVIATFGCIVHANAGRCSDQIRSSPDARRVPGGDSGKAPRGRPCAVCAGRRRDDHRLLYRGDRDRSHEHAAIPGGVVRLPRFL